VFRLQSLQSNIDDDDDDDDGPGRRTFFIKCFLYFSIFIHSD